MISIGGGSYKKQFSGRGDILGFGRAKAEMINQGGVNNKKQVRRLKNNIRKHTTHVLQAYYKRTTHVLYNKNTALQCRRGEMGGTLRATEK